MKKIYMVSTKGKAHSDDAYYFGKKGAMRCYKDLCEAISDGFADFSDIESVELWRCIDMHDGRIRPVDLICSKKL